MDRQVRGWRYVWRCDRCHAVEVAELGDNVIVETKHDHIACGGQMEISETEVCPVGLMAPRSEIPE